MARHKLVNGVKIDLISEEETARANAKISGKTKLKAGEALTDDEISSLFGE